MILKNCLSLHDFEVSLKKSCLKENQGKNDIVLFLGKSREEEVIFRFTDNELPFKCEKEFINRKKFGTDYAQLIKEEGFEKTFNIRLKNYLSSHEKY